MTKPRRKLRFLPLLALMLALMVLSPTAALAETAEKTVDLTITTPHKNNPVQGAEFSLYLVTESPFGPDYPLTEKFEDYPVSLEPLETDHLRVLASTLDTYISVDDIDPDYTGRTGQNGKVSFHDLPQGIYLVTGKAYNSGGYTYTPTPHLVSLPQHDGEAWDYVVSITAKADVKAPPPPEEPPPVEVFAQVSVLKVWDDGNSPERPAQVSVSLYNSGSLWSTVTLSKENNWQHTWSMLPLDGYWAVAENDVPEGYTVTVEQQAARFVVTNYAPVEEPPETPPDTPPDKPGKPLDPDDPLYWLDEDGLPLDWRDHLPQTGVLWWPVPVLLSGGLFLMLVGVLLRRRKPDEA